MVLILKAASYASIMGVVFSIFTTTAVPIFKNLDKINKVGKVKSYIGLHSLFYVLKFMYDRIKSDNWTNIDALQMMNAIMYASFINVFLTLSFPAVMLLAQFGKNRKSVRRGLRVLDTIFNGR